MNTKHTSGPWHTDDFVFAANGLRIADCYCDGQEEHMSEAEISANMTLIAAAPELLAALESLCESFKCHNSDYDVHDGYKEACTAIAKAHGRICGEPLFDNGKPIGVCTQPFGTEHSHQD